MNAPQVTNEEAIAKRIELGIGSDFKRISTLLDGRMKPERFANLCLQAARGNDKLLQSFQSSPASLLAAIMTCAQLGLEPNTARKEAYLIPRWSKHLNANEATLQIGYHGFIAMARRSPNFQKIAINVVTTEEIEAGCFDFSFEPPAIRHDFKIGVCRKVTMQEHESLTVRDRYKKRDVPIMTPKNLAGAYARVETKDGQIAQVFLTAEEIHDRRMRSSAPNGNFWVNDFAAMAKKSAVRALFSSGEVALNDELSEAVNMEQRVEDGGESMAVVAEAVQMRAEVPKELPSGPTVTGPQEFGSDPSEGPDDVPDQPPSEGQGELEFGEGEEVPIDPGTPNKGAEWMDDDQFK